MSPNSPSTPKLDRDKPTPGTVPVLTAHVRTATGYQPIGDHTGATGFLVGGAPVTLDPRALVS
ncbi:hypothetical protein [Sciscionella sediminilitoris]|uniref:hypothetical protein n=1 Tax=Sciscionella sediminilitoris TaxID=1445613 RepID=UPI0004DFBD23|nr:hypothetical protein [Sciscionella sp. SE31]